MSVSIVYFITGAFFTYLSVQSMENTVWNGTTVILMIVATLSFGAGIRYMRNHLKSKHEKR